MESSLQKIIAALVGVLILFIIPVYIAYEKVDDVSYSLALKLTQNFVDNVRDKGYISPDMYGDYVSGLYATNNAYAIEIEHVKKRYDPAIYIYSRNIENNKKDNLLYVLDYDRYTVDGKVPDTITVNGSEYTSEDYVIELAHVINEERITDNQIVKKLFENTGVSKVDFLRNCLLGNADMYDSLIYMNENSYILNEGDKINVTIKNSNRTVASIFYSMFTANVGGEEIPKIYVEYGGTVNNNGANIVSTVTGDVDDTNGRMFKYSGRAEEITLAEGTYTIECWGAAGGGKEEGITTTGGKGAYAKGAFKIYAETTLYVYVGAKGTEYSEDNANNGGYNGGGTSYKGYGGGGASDVRLLKGDWQDIDSLNSRIIVAAGGGGSSKVNGDSYGTGGAGGTNIGFNGEPNSVDLRGFGAGTTNVPTEFEEFELGMIGKGGDADYDGAGAGGAGYYGGTAAHAVNAGGGGGNSYVYNNEEITLEPDSALNNLLDLTNSKWKNISLEDSAMIGGEDSMPNPIKFTGTDEITGNSGNGYVIIKKIS